MVKLMPRKRSMSKICLNEEVSSKEWEFVNLNKDEEDLVYRMHKLLGDRWELIAGRIPGRRAEEIERFWLMKHGEQFAEKRRKSVANASK